MSTKSTSKYCQQSPVLNIVKKSSSKYVTVTVFVTREASMYYLSMLWSVCCQSLTVSRVCCQSMTLSWSVCINLNFQQLYFCISLTRWPNDVTQWVYKQIKKSFVLGFVDSPLRVVLISRVKFALTSWKNT